LLDGLSGKLLKSTQTTYAGEFNFDDVGPGLYFVVLIAPMVQELSGTIVVHVDSNAPADHLEIALNHTPCGLAYSDLRQCSRGELRLSQLRGRVADTSGAAIGNADVDLFDSNGQIVGQSHSDDMGRFALTRSLPGTYKLVVGSNGFAVSRTTVHLVSSDDASAHAQVKIELGLAGSCSAAYDQ
jgi:Carboxypeptidase regulatory-like domain